MSYDYSENILVQESVVNIFRDELDWELKFAYEIISNLLPKLISGEFEVCV